METTGDAAARAATVVAARGVSGVERDDLLAAVARRRIRFKTLSRPLKILTLLAVLVVAALAALLTGVRGLPVEAPVWLSTIAMTLGTACILAAAIYLPLPVRLLIVAGLTALLGWLPAMQLAMNQPQVAHLRPYRMAQLAVLASCWFWAVAVSAARRRAVSQSGGRHPGRTVAAALGLVLAFYAIEAAMSFVYDGTTDSLNYIIQWQMSWLLPVLIVVILWASTDVVEWAHAGASTVVAGAQRLAGGWLVIPLALAASGVVLWSVFRDGVAEPTVFLAGLAGAAALAALAVGLVRLARLDGAARPHVPTSALLLCALLTGLPLVARPYILASASGTVWGTAVVYVLNPVVQMLYALGMLTVGLALIAAGRMRDRAQPRVAGLLLALVALGIIGWQLERFLIVTHLAAFALPIPTLPILLDMLAATCTLALALAMCVSARLRASARGALAALLVLLGTLEFFQWLFLGTSTLDGLRAVSAVAGAGIFLGAILWDFLMSGEDVTNGDTGRFPREGRVLLYLGYVVVASAAIVLYAVGRAAFPHADVFALDAWVSSQGIAALGVPLAVTLFAVRLGRERGTGGALPRSPAARILPGLAAVGVGLVCVGLVVALLVNEVAPRLGSAAFVSPSVACDYGFTNSWFMTGPKVRKTCHLHGMTLAVGNENGGAGFTPVGQFPARYHLSVRADLSSLANGACAAILIEMPATQTRGVGDYGYAVCSAGDVFIYRADRPATAGAPASLPQPSLVALSERGRLPQRLGTVTIDIHADGASQDLTVDGVHVSAHDTTYPAPRTIFFGLVHGNDNGASATFSDLVFAPLE